MPKSLSAADGAVNAITFEKTMLKDGKLAGTGESFTLAADMVLTAIGQILVADDFGGAAVLEVKGGKIVTDADGATSVKGVWAGGDCTANGEDLTVSAVENGKLAALAIDRALRA